MHPSTIGCASKKRKKKLNLAIIFCVCINEAQKIVGHFQLVSLHGKKNDISDKNVVDI